MNNRANQQENGNFDRDVQDITNFMNVQNAALKMRSFHKYNDKQSVKLASSGYSC